MKDLCFKFSYFKYQKVYWNYKRKSTKGWSMFNVMQDLTGGVFAFVQIIVDDLNGHGREN